jgi:protein phosphatase PTC7
MQSVVAAWVHLRLDTLHGRSVNESTANTAALIQANNVSNICAHISEPNFVVYIQVVYRSPQQLHFFNCPLQIGIGIDGETDHFESPVDADLLSVPVQVGDVLIVATDGLFDNVPEESIIEHMAASMEEMEVQEENTPHALPKPFIAVSGSATNPPTNIGPVSPLTAVATSLARLAHRLSLDKMIDSPFAQLAKDNNILWKNGGRKDDITVIVARVDAIPTNHTRLDTKHS